MKTARIRIAPLRKALRLVTFWQGRMRVIALHDGDSRTVIERQNTADGWYCDVEVLSRHGNVILREYTSTGRDCDGLLRSEGDYQCHRDQLHAAIGLCKPGQSKRFRQHLVPKWEYIDGCQIDQYAQAAGF